MILLRINFPLRVGASPLIPFTDWNIHRGCTLSVTPHRRPRRVGRFVEAPLLALVFIFRFPRQSCTVYSGTHSPSAAAVVTRQSDAGSISEQFNGYVGYFDRYIAVRATTDPTE